MVDFWQHILSSDLPLIMYGTGNGADKIFSEFDRLGIKVDGIFASDGFVRERYFHDIKVKSYDDIIAEFGENINIVISFGTSLPDVINRFRYLATKHNVFIPDVPVSGGDIFNSEFYLKHVDEINTARELFADAESKILFDNIIDYKLSGRIEPLFNSISSPNDVNKNILNCTNYRITADLGAYTGDTIAELLSNENSIETVIAVEPDQKNFSKLCLNTFNDIRIERHMCATWNDYDVLKFSKGGGRGISHLKDKTIDVIAKPFDGIACGRKIDFIKYDVEGVETEAIDGSIKTISSFKPDLQIAVYHKSEDIFKFPIMIHNINKDYKLYLRRYLSMPAWDINLFAVNGAKA